jgi:alanine racemase
VKADGYGRGAAAIAQALAKVGARTFFVAHVGEGVALRAALGARPTIYVLHGADDPLIETCVAADLTPVISCAHQIEPWRSKQATCAVQVDTGMNRLGLSAHWANAASQALGGQVKLVMSHLACASDPNAQMNIRQRALFDDLCLLFPSAKRSLAASGGALKAGFGYDLIRPGIGLYGGAPLDCDSPPLATVATVTAPVLQTRAIQAGETVGYGATFTAPKDGHIATIAAGYADGVLRSLSGKGYAALDGRTFPYAGRVSMDMITLWDEAGALTPGDDVELLGAAVPVDDLAARAGTIAYEVLTQLARTPRAYHGSP